MISLKTAQQLKAAGLIWKTSINDFFGLPDREMDDRIFVLTDMQAQTDIFKGWPVIIFHGSPEWALDYILTTEAIWLPTESQLRQNIVDFIKDDPDATLQLTQTNQEITCKLITQSGTNQFQGANASEAYALTLLHLLQQYS